MPAFSNAPRLVGANSQCFRSATFTKRASVGSSKSMVCGKLSGRMKVAFVDLISSMRWYSLPLPLMMYCTPNSSPILSARSADHLSLVSKICGKLLFALKLCKLRFRPSCTGFVLYQFASRYCWRNKAMLPINELG